jgi:Ni/Co efflux regulator RcnB
VRKLTTTIAIPLLALTLGGVPSFAQDHHDDQDRRDNQTYVRHDDWRSGNRIRKEDWDRGQHVEYRDHHLRRPPNGYEWRDIDGQYVLASPDGRIRTVRPHEHHDR